MSLLAETAIRKVLFPPELEALRGVLRPTLTPVAWGLLGVTCLAALAVVPAHRAIHRRMQQRVAERHPGDLAARQEAMQGALYLGASIVQLPTLVATVAFMMGAALVPVLVALLVAALGVLAIGLWGPSE
jgi:hypothetical protein